VGLRVLVVDDDSMVLEITASMLEELDCEVLRAQSATEALATLNHYLAKPGTGAGLCSMRFPIPPRKAH
jgi:CheY-like chemotaxis protein